MQRSVCKFFAAGKCTNGNQCTYVHNQPNQKANIYVKQHQPPQAKTISITKSQKKEKYEDLGNRFVSNPKPHSNAYQATSSANAVEDPNSSIWVPPLELQQTQIANYTLFFPIELTNKDYVRRILEIVAIGIRERILQITLENQFTSIPVDNDHDIYYLLNQLKGYTKGDTDIGVQRMKRQTFAEQLHCDPTKLNNSCDFLYDTRNSLSHFDITITDDILTKIFQASKELLECFNTRVGNTSLRLANLKSQSDTHKEFRATRIEKLGWIDETTQNNNSGNFDHSFDLKCKPSMLIQSFIR